MEVRKSLVAALKKAHKEFCTPPEMMKEENKARWRPRVRTDIEWDSLLNTPEDEDMRRAEIRTRGDVSMKHPILSQAASLASSIEELSKAEAKKLRRLQRQEDLDNKSRQQKVRTAKETEEDSHADEEESGNDDSNADEDDEAEAEDAKHYEQPPYLSIGLIGQPKYVYPCPC